MAPGKKNLKATKKFEKNKLHGVLEKRKASAKTKQRYLLNDKKKARRPKDEEFYKGPQDGDAAAAKNIASIAGSKAKKVGEMSVDDFFSGGFDEIISKDNKLGKRKRGAANEKSQKAKEDDEDGSDESSPEQQQQPPPPPIDSEDDDDDEGGMQLDGMSKQTMDELAKKDPDFYKFLKENDPETLDFDDNADLAEVDDLSGSEEEAEEEQPKKKRKKAAKEKEQMTSPEGSELTREMVARWKKAMAEKHSLRAARQAVLAFRVAAHLNEDDEEEETQQRWKINSPEVFNDVLLLALKQVPVVMNHHLPVKESSSGKAYVQTETNKFRTLSLLLKTFTSSIMHLLSTLSDEATLKLTLSSLTPILPYLLSFKKLIKALAKSVVNFWAQPASTETTRLTAFLVLRRLVVIGDKGIRESVLKATYQGLVQGCRVTNHNTIQGINLMKNSAAELWGLDQGVGYSTAFTFIRQLAIHLRNSIVNNQNNAFRIVYNWQYTHSLDFWSRVLAEHCSPQREAEAGKESQLRLLIYPLVQVTLGALRLIPTAVYFPLRFHLIRSLLRTSRATGTFIPLAAPLLEVLNSAEMRKPPKNTTLKAFDFTVAYKAPKSYLRTRVYQDGVGEQVIELLGEYFFLWSTSVALPELVLPLLIQLKRWLKQTRSRSQGNRNAKLGTSLVLLVQKLEANAKFIEERRAKVDFAPKNRTQVEGFLKDFDVTKTPLGAYVVGQRKVRAQKAQMLEEARKEEDEKRRQEEKGSDHDDDDDDDDDVEDGSEDEDAGLGMEDEDEEEEDDA